MSSEEVFVQQFAKLFVHYRDALTLDTTGEQGNELQKLNEIPAVEFDRMVSAARLAVLEIATKARQRDDARLYYAEAGEVELDSNEDMVGGTSGHLAAGAPRLYNEAHATPRVAS
jgi:hypothetical protein